MAIANGTCVSFCNQPKAQFSYPRRVTPVYVVAFTRFAGGGIWLPQESLCTIWPGYAPGTIAVNVTWIERGFSACQTHRSMYSSIFNRNYELQRAILVGNCNFFLPLPPSCIYRPRWGCSRWNFGKKFGPYKTRIIGLPGSEDSLTIG